MAPGSSNYQIEESCTVADLKDLFKIEISTTLYQENCCKLIKTENG